MSTAMRCYKCGYDFSGSGDSAHVCGPVIDRVAAIRIATVLGWEPKRKWVGLTNEEIKQIYDEWRDKVCSDAWGYERAIEAKLKEKNT